MTYILENARSNAEVKGLKYAGDLLPAEAWKLVENKVATLVDVRSKEELHLVGRIPEIINVPWLKGLKLEANPRFTLELSKAGRKDDIILLICRSGKRSVDAAEAAHRAGFKHVFNVKYGVEGAEHGWSHIGLPWIED